MIRKRMIATLTALTLLLPLCASAADFSPLNIYLVRHAETIGNVTGDHTYENDRTFSDAGKKQVELLISKLDKIKIDAVIVSPKYRTMNTIFPWLKKHKMKAEIWPELAECCWQRKRDANFAFSIPEGGLIEIERPMRPYFSSSGKREYAPFGYADGMLMVFKTYDEIMQRYAGSGKTLLIISHYHSGGRLIELLQGLEPEGRHQLYNAGVSHLRENRDGTFSLLSLNR